MIDTNNNLTAFGSRILEDLLQGEWEPDFCWKQEMLELAEEIGLVTTRPADQEDDPEEYDFLYERAAAKVPFKTTQPPVADVLNDDPPIHTLTADDFTAVNFGIWVYGDDPVTSYKFQLQCPFDHVRASQNGPVAIIGREIINVKDWDEALKLFNEHFKESQMEALEQL